MGANATSPLTLAFIKETKRTKEVRADYAAVSGWSWAVLLLPLSQANSRGWGIKLLGLLARNSGADPVGAVGWPGPPSGQPARAEAYGVWQGGGHGWSSIVSSSRQYPALSAQTPVASGFGFGKSMFVVSLARHPGLSYVSPLPPRLIMRMPTAKGTMLLRCSSASPASAWPHGSFWLVML